MLAKGDAFSLQTLFQENEKSRDVLIEQRFHKHFIGTKGEAIQKLREQFPSVIFMFPDAGKNSDVVNLRGEKNEVDKAFKHLTAMNKELVSLICLRMCIPSDFRHHLYSYIFVQNMC